MLNRESYVLTKGNGTNHAIGEAVFKWVRCKVVIIELYEGF